MNMTPMEQDAYAQGQMAARCGWFETENPHREDATKDAWDAGYRKWLGITAPVAPARQECETAELFLPS